MAVIDEQESPSRGKVRGEPRNAMINTVVPPSKTILAFCFTAGRLLVVGNGEML